MRLLRKSLLGKDGGGCMIRFRAALEEDAENLSNLAFNSEKYLGYDANYMSRFSDFYNVTESFIDQHLVYIMEEAGRALGFWGLNETENIWELEFFYISPEYIGKGYGRKLWDSLVAECKKRGISEFQMVTSPQSSQFYEKMGAKVIGQSESLIVKGRMVPRLEFCC